MSDQKDPFGPPRKTLNDLHNVFGKISDEGSQFEMIRRSASAYRSIVKEALGAKGDELHVCRKAKLMYDEGRSFHILLVVSDTGGWLGVRPLIEQALESDRVSDVSVYASGMALGHFKNHPLQSRFRRIDSEGESAYFKLSELGTGAHSNRPAECAVVTVASALGPEAIALSQSKTSLDVRSLFLIFEGWTGLGAAFRHSSDLDWLLDGILCNDDLAKRIISASLPRFPQERIFVSGTGQMERTGLEEAAKHRRSGCSKLGIYAEETVLALLGDISGHYKVPEIRATFNEDTLRKFTACARELAIAAPERRFATIVRPHPADPRGDELRASLLATSGLPDNLRLIDGNLPFLSVEEVCCSAHAVASIISTESFKAHLNGSYGVFLVFEDEPGLGAAVMDQVFSANIQETLSRSEGIKFVRSGLELIEFLRDLPARHPVLPVQEARIGTTRMLDALLQRL